MNGNAKRRLGLAALMVFLACEERVVAPADVARVELEPEVLTLRVGATSQFHAILYDGAGNALTGRDITWSIEDSGVGAVADNGAVIGTAIGETRVIARAGGQQGSATLRVTSNTVASVEVVPAEAAVELGATRSFEVVVRATDGTTLTDRTPAWSSTSAAVATVNGNGVLTGVGLGSTTLVATVDEVRGEASVAIVAPPLTGLRVDPSTASVRIGQQIRLTAIGLREGGGEAPGLPVAWRSLSPNIATVDDAGLVTAVADGEARIEAGFGRHTGAATITVTPIPAASIDVEPGMPAILVNDTLRLVATVRSAEGAVLNRTPAWSSSAPAIATVDAGGLVRGVSSGFAYVVASLDGARDSALVRVAQRPVAAVVVLPSESTLRVGQTVQLSAQVISDDGSTQTREITWSTSSTDIATVNGSGLVTARSSGVAVIRATAGGVTGSAVVNVDPPPITSIEVRPATLELEVGETGTLTAVGLRESGEEVSGLVVTWSTGDADVATVSATGTVTAEGAGSTSVTATYQGLTASAAVTVTAPSSEPATVSISGSDFSLEVGEEQQLSATVRNAAGDVLADAEVDWSSTSGSVASVSASGLVTALAVGNTYIVAVAGSARDSVRVTVTPVAVASVVVTPSLATIEEDDSIRLTATVYDDAGNVLNRTVVWSTNATSVVEVSQNGTVRGKKTGVAIVTASVEGRSDSATIIVVDDGPELL